jgi:uncharacterized membrane protein (UPF0127 family)
LLYTSSSSKNFTTVTIGEKSIRAEIADTEVERSNGLSGRASLEKGTGMVFVFDEAKKHPFWMKDMNFSIDIIWIDDGKIVDITYQARPEEKDSKYLTIYKPDVPAKFVLEVPSGYSKENDIKEGDLVEGPIFQ